MSCICYTCNTPVFLHNVIHLKTPHMYYRCNTTGHVGKGNCIFLSLGVSTICSLRSWICSDSIIKSQAMREQQFNSGEAGFGKCLEGGAGWFFFTSQTNFSWALTSIIKLSTKFLKPGDLLLEKKKWNFFCFKSMCYYFRKAQTHLAFGGNYNRKASMSKSAPKDSRSKLPKRDLAAKYFGDYLQADMYKLNLWFY